MALLLENLQPPLRSYTVWDSSNSDNRFTVPQSLVEAPMNEMQSSSHWYMRAGDDPCLDPAREAFEEAIDIFSSKLTKDSQKRIISQQATSLADIQKIALEAKERYDTSRRDGKAREWLSEFASRVKCYGHVLDVLSQHHPEYVSLAWGIMKFLFVTVVNHEAMISSLAEGLCQIADALPHSELVTVLYPTDSMKHAVAKLYANIIKFFIRARDWYKESPLLHALHSITRPVELRYQDLLDAIRRCSRHVEKMAMAAFQTEQRDIRLMLHTLMDREQKSDALLMEVKQMIVVFQSATSSAFLDTSQRLSDLQLSQIMTFISDVAGLDAAKSLQYSLVMRNRRQLKPAPAVEPFWLGPKLQAWASAKSSSLIMVRGTFQNRFGMKDFCVDFIGILREAEIPVLWALKSSYKDTDAVPSMVDLLKHLVCQALRLNVALQTESFLGPSCAAFRRAMTEDDWFNLLGSVLAGLPQIYIVIDVEMLSSLFPPLTKDFSLPLAFLGLFQKLSDRGVKTRVKVILVSYGSTMFLQQPQGDLQERVIHVGRGRKSVTPRKKKSASQSLLGRKAMAVRQSRLQTLVGKPEA